MKQEYTATRAAGNRAGMKATYNKAQRARAKYGSYIDSIGDGTVYSYFGEEGWSAADRAISDEDRARMWEYKLGFTLADFVFILFPPGKPP